jgi:hypothetical protein
VQIEARVAGRLPAGRSIDQAGLSLPVGIHSAPEGHEHEAGFEQVAPQPEVVASAMFAMSPMARCALCCRGNRVGGTFCAVRT